MLDDKAKPPTYTMCLTVALVVTGLLYLISAEAARVFLLLVGSLIGFTLLFNKVLKPFGLYLFSSVLSILAGGKRLLAGVRQGGDALRLYFGGPTAAAESEPVVPDKPVPPTPQADAPSRVLN